MEGHRGPDPDHPETRYAEEIKVVIYKHYIIITCDVSRQQQQQLYWQACSSKDSLYFHVITMPQSACILHLRTQELAWEEENHFYRSANMHCVEGRTSRNYIAYIG
ncbi:hypothetical protein ACJX0J_036939, partial [Zea mays]